jgi:hypothetical protein
MTRPALNRLITGTALLTGLLFAVGCGGSGKCNVTGKVLFNGKPVYGGMVIIVDDKDRTAQGAIEFDGTYTVRDAPTGKVRVGVVSPKPQPARGDRGGGRGGAANEPVADPTKWFAIPDKYGEPNSSGKEMTLKGGNNTQDIILE